MLNATMPDLRHMSMTVMTSRPGNWSKYIDDSMYLTPSDPIAMSGLNTVSERQNNNNQPCTPLYSDSGGSNRVPAGSVTMTSTSIPLLPNSSLAIWIAIGWYSWALVNAISTSSSSPSWAVLFLRRLMSRSSGIIVSFQQGPD